MLAKQYRLTKRGSFTYLYNRGERKSRGPISLVFLGSGKTKKIGFSVPNKVGKAHVRNLLKRRLRAIVRQQLPRIKSAQIILCARAEADKLGFVELRCIVQGLLTKAGLCHAV